MNLKSLCHCALSLLLGTGLLLFTLCPLDAAEFPPDSVQKASLQSLIDLDRHYDLSFLWFDRLAIGQLSFARDPSAPNRYRAILDAKTLGVAAWLTGDRKQHYETLMELTPQGRFVAIEYRSMIHKKKGEQVIEQTKKYNFEPATRTIFVTRSKVGQKRDEKPLKIVCEHCPVDFLTAGFNFIFGADGPLEAGARKEILTFTDKGERNIFIEVLSEADRPKTSFLKGSGTLLKITLPTEILDTGGGAVYALLDDKVLPQRVIVENVLGLGDVRGELRP